MSQKPQRWWESYRNDAEKNVFVGKDGKSGLCRSEYDWRSTEALARESGLTKRKVEEILDYYCKKGTILQNSKDPEKWGYWERVGTAKADPDVVKKDHEDRMSKVQNAGLTPAPVKAPQPSPTKSGTTTSGGNPLTKTPSTPSPIKKSSTKTSPSAPTP